MQHDASCLVRAAPLLLAAALLVACSPPPPQPPPPPPLVPLTSLVVAVHSGPTSWFPGPDGEPQGFEHDLIKRFAAERNLPLAVRTVERASDAIALVAAGDAHLALGELLRSPAANPDPEVAALRVLWTQGHRTVAPVLIGSAEGFRPRGFGDLRGATVEYLSGDGVEMPSREVREANPYVRWHATLLPSADALIAQVDEGEVDYAVVASSIAAALRTVYAGFDVAFEAGAPSDVAWAVRNDQADLVAELDAFLQRMKRDGVLARLANRYFDHPPSVGRIDSGVFQDRIRGVLPQYRTLFQDAQEQTGIEWRLLAAIAYQESQWDPAATSETGVRGFMQLTEETARHLGAVDRLDPRASVLAAARYLRDLKARIPARIQEPDRTWLALAAFNIGMGHLEDARILAQKQRLNPDLWRDVRTTLPLLAQPEHYENAKLGYARGGMPVALVDRVRAYYDILLRQQAPHQPRLRAYAPLASP